MAFQAPFEIAQSQLRDLRLSSVDSREVVGAIYPFFLEDGATRFLIIHTSGDQEAGGGGGGLWAVDEFPLEIRNGKAIYPRPIVNYRPLADLDPGVLAGHYHFDAGRVLAAHPALPEATLAALQDGNIALRSRGRESVRDLFFTLDLRRLSGAVSRSGLLLRRRLEIAALKTFLRDTAPSSR